MWLVGGPALKHEAPVAIAALDEADVIVDHIIDSRMAQRGIDLTGTVAKNAVVFGSKNFRRRLHGIAPSNRLPPHQ
jgi:hypothetical protein